MKIKKINGPYFLINSLLSGLLITFVLLIPKISGPSDYKTEDRFYSDLRFIEKIAPGKNGQQKEVRLGSKDGHSQIYRHSDKLVKQIELLKSHNLEKRYYCFQISKNSFTNVFNEVIYEYVAEQIVAERCP